VSGWLQKKTEVDLIARNKGPFHSVQVAHQSLPVPLVVITNRSLYSPPLPPPNSQTHTPLLLGCTVSCIQVTTMTKPKAFASKRVLQPHVVSTIRRRHVLIQGIELLLYTLLFTNFSAACSEISMPHTTSTNSLKLTCPSPFLSAFLMNSFVSVFMSADPSYVEEM
jgi:hypothetical protein